MVGQIDSRLDFCLRVFLCDAHGMTPFVVKDTERKTERRICDTRGRRRSAAAASRSLNISRTPAGFKRSSRLARRALRHAILQAFEPHAVLSH
jgi:hypothetical protein